MSVVNNSDPNLNVHIPAVTETKLMLHLSRYLDETQLEEFCPISEWMPELQPV
jgi:hypothetical protein